MKPLSIPAAKHVRTLCPGQAGPVGEYCTGVCQQASGASQPAKNECRTEDMAS